MSTWRHRIKTADEFHRFSPSGIEFYGKRQPDGSWSGYRIKNGARYDGTALTKTALLTKLRAAAK